MARKSLIEKNLKRKRLIERFKEKRVALKMQISNKKLTLEERFELVLKLNSMPRDTSSSRYHNRCEFTGRSRGYYRMFGLSRNKLRELASSGKMPGVTKASWG